MNCSEIIQLLPAYLANEVTPSERKLIQNHLAACADCQNEMRVLAALQSRIRESLHNQAAESAPSPQAWSRLQTRLDSPARADVPIRSRPWLRSLQRNIHIGAFEMKRIAFAALAVLILLAGTVAAVPGVRAAVLENVTGWFGYDFPSPNSDNLLSLGTNWGFSPFSPRYMPDGLDIRGTMVEGDQTVDTLGLCYQPEHREQGSPFVAIVQKSMDELKSLPSGTQVSIGGTSGSIDELPAGEIEWCLGPSFEGELVRVPEGQEAGPPQEFPPDEPLTYEKALRLTYFQGDIKIEIFGPYSQKELVRIAKSMQQANLAAEQPEQPESQP